MAQAQRAIISGFTAVGFGLVITFLISLVVDTPWDLGNVLLAVGFASFFGAFFAALYTERASRRA